MNNSVSRNSSIGSGTPTQWVPDFLKDTQGRKLTEERVRVYEGAQEEKRSKTVELPTVVPEGEHVDRRNTAPVHRLPLVDVDEKGRDETRFPGDENRQVVVIFTGFGGSLPKLGTEQWDRLKIEHDKIEAFEEKLKGRPLKLKVPIEQNGCDKSGTHLMNDIKKSGEKVRDTPENKHPAVQPEGSEKGRNTGVQHSRRSIWARLCAGVSHCCAVVTRRPRQTPIDPS